ncbi:MAG: 50S ribosomal protein L11 methyltransferase, partial [Clostridiales bacterium]|nr:50S ribosomal protein L11 methyltransferase [Clostridiales bacterium]
MDWIEVKIYTESEGIEAICARLMDLGAGAVQIEDPKEMTAFIQQNTNPKNWDYVEDELLDIQGRDTYVKVYLTNDWDGLRLLENINLAMDEMRNKDFGIDMGSLKVDHIVVSDENWVDNWKKYYKPFELGNNIVIRP